MIRLMICDDHDLIRTAFTRLLEVEGRFSVVAQAASREQLLITLPSQARDIDVLLLDLNLKTTDSQEGIDTIRELGRLYPNLPVLVVSGYDEPAIVKAALAAGAHGFVTKGSEFEVLKQAIRHIHLGDKFLDPRVVKAVVSFDASPSKPAWNAELSKREQEVFCLICKGQRVSDIALALNLSVKTISTHKIRLMEKLKVDNNADLIKIGLVHNIR
jgi:DNA-binding NarL/FixJ family response regulator